MFEHNLGKRQRKPNNNKTNNPIKNHRRFEQIHYTEHENMFSIIGHQQRQIKATPTILILKIKKNNKIKC